MEQLMEMNDTSFARSDATAEQIDAIKRRRASGNAGPICLIGDVRRRVNNDHREGRFRWLDYFTRWLHRDCD